MRRLYLRIVLVHFVESIIIPTALRDPAVLNWKVSGGTSYILYGSYDGVYMLDRTARAAPRLVLMVPDVLQLDVLEDHNLLVFKSGKIRLDSSWYRHVDLVLLLTY